jgi:hypothetical protein
VPIQSENESEKKTVTANCEYCFSILKAKKKYAYKILIYATILEL